MELNRYTKSYYKIREVSEFVGVPQSTLRYWEKEFAAHVKPMRNASNIRYYTPDDIENLHIIKYLIHTQGMRVEAAKAQLAKNKRNLTNRIRALRELTDLRDELKLMLDALKKRR